jgi:hypothetical protein
LIIYGALEIATQAQCHLEETGNALVSTEIIRSVLREASFKAGKKRKVSFLQPQYSRARLVWAKKYKNCAVEEWRRII